MPSLTTIFRAMVMMAVGAIVFKGWQLYGPPAEQVKSVAAQSRRYGEAAWKNFQMPDKLRQPAACDHRRMRRHLRRRSAASGRRCDCRRRLDAQTLTPSPPAGAIPSTSAPATQSLPSRHWLESAPATGTRR